MTTVMRPDGARFRLAKDSAGQELLLPIEGSDIEPSQMQAAQSFLGLTKAAAAAAAETDPHTDETATSMAAAGAAAEDTSTGASQAMDATPCTRFDPNDPRILEHLDEFGFAVVAAMGSADARNEAEELLMAFLEEHAGWDHTDPSTWTTESFENVADTSKGILYKRGIGQSQFQWFIRTQPGVRASFQTIWGTDELLTSFDGCNVFRPWHSAVADPSWKTLGGWWHVDQGRSKLGRHAVQGLVTLRDANAQTGGLCVIPGSHRHHERIAGNVEGYTDYVRIHDGDPVMDLPKKLVVAQAGDLILWDSRTVHCNTPALAEHPPTEAQHPTTDFLRIASYVCMTPSSMADSAIVRVRQRAYCNRMTTGHWPHCFPTGTCGKEVSGGLDLASASVEVQRLVSGLGE